MRADDRTGPPDVSPINVGGLTLSVIQPGRQYEPYGAAQLLATDATTGQEAWRAVIYRIDYDPDREEDVQDVFVASLDAGDDGHSVVVADEDGGRYRISLDTRQVDKTSD